MVRPTTPGSGLLVYFSNIVYQNREWDLQTFNFDQDMAHTDEVVGRHGQLHVHRLLRGDSPRRQDHPVSRLERSDTAACLQPSVLRAGGEGQRRSRENAGVLPAVHGSRDEPLQRRHRRVEFRRRGAADSARFAMRRTICRPRWRTGSNAVPHRPQFIGTKYADTQPDDENGAVHASDLPVSDRGHATRVRAIQTTRRTSRAFVRNRMMAQLAQPQKKGTNPLSNWAVGLPEDATAVHSSAGRVDGRPVM